VLIGIITIVLMLWEPHIESRNAHATLFEIYFKDPFLAYAYIASIPFFVVLYQALKILRYARQNKLFSQATIKALRTIKFCAIVLVALIAVPLVYLFIVRPEDDIAGGVAVSLFLIFVSTIIAASAAVFERNLQSAMDIKSETDLTAQ
jgi:hypothetical protein